MTTRITQLLGIEKPIIQAGMVWCSGWKLASAVSREGALGVIGAGSMNAELLDHHLGSMHQNGQPHFAVNLPLLYTKLEDQLTLILKHRVPIVITSAGNPALHTKRLKAEGIRVIHVVSSTKFALKAQDAGVDAIVAEGFEAGGHNGREETTTLCLLEDLYGKLDIPVIAAGGIATGRAMLATQILGAEGFQIGTLFAAALESSAHPLFKQLLIDSREGATQLTLKELTPVRMIKNAFFSEIQKAYQNGASIEDLQQLLGKGRSRRGILEGDLENGELEIGQIVSVIERIEPAAAIIDRLMREYQQAKKSIHD